MTEQPQRTLDDVLALIAKLAKATAGSQFLYRGEPKKYRKVSSSLYRRFSRIASQDFDIQVVQKEIVEKAKLYSDLTNEREILAQLQHYGYPTNLIDFTTDYNIALFFACDGYPGYDGRIVLVERPDNLEAKPNGPQNRMLAQKSVFQEPETGILVPDSVVIVPKALKGPILDYLRRSHGISSATVYNDLHGFIKYQRVHESAYTHFYFGLASLKGQNHEDAIEHYSKAIALNSQLSDLYNNRGVSYRLTGDLENSMKDLNRALELDPDSLTALINRNSTAQDLGDPALALQDLNRILQLDPDSAFAYNSRGNLYVSLGMTTEALEDYERAIQLDPDLFMAYNNKGNLLSQLGKCLEALDAFSAALKREPSNPNILANRGAVYARCEDYKSAIADYTQSIDLDPHHAVAYLNRGEAKLNLGSENNSSSIVAEAIEDLSKAIEIDPQYVGAHYMRGLARTALGDNARAYDDLCRARDLAIESGQESLRSLAANALTKIGGHQSTL